MKFASRSSILNFELVNLMLHSLTFPGESITITPTTWNIFPFFFGRKRKRNWKRKRSPLHERIHENLETGSLSENDQPPSGRMVSNPHLGSRRSGKRIGRACCISTSREIRSLSLLTKIGIPYFHGFERRGDRALRR